jgi:hypothetical protein
MITFLYTCLHLPTGQRFARMARYDSLRLFYADLCRWNTQQPTVWAYAPTGDTQ